MLKRLTIVIAMLAAMMVAPGIAQANNESCRVVKLLERAGFTGHKNRIAYAIVMRESRGVNLDESSRWYTGALGIWQVQTSAHRNKPWHSRAAMLNPQRQSRIVYRHMTNRGTWWAHWGIRSDGRGMDTRFYRGWTPRQHWNWIWAPYDRFYRAYPRCR